MQDHQIKGTSNTVKENKQDMGKHGDEQNLKYAREYKQAKTMDRRQKLQVKRPEATDLKKNYNKE